MLQEHGSTAENWILDPHDPDAFEHSLRVVAMAATTALMTIELPGCETGGQSGVLYGAQGVGKSKILEFIGMAIGGEYGYCTKGMDLLEKSDRDRFQELSAACIVEISEVDENRTRLWNTSNTLKAFLSKRQLHFTRKNQNETVVGKVAHATAFTTNIVGMFKDYTGLRRYEFAQPADLGVARNVKHLKGVRAAVRQWVAEYKGLVRMELERERQEQIGKKEITPRIPLGFMPGDGGSDLPFIWKERFGTPWGIINEPDREKYGFSDAAQRCLGSKVQHLSKGAQNTAQKNCTLTVQTASGKEREQVFMLLRNGTAGIVASQIPAIYGTKRHTSFTKSDVENILRENGYRKKTQEWVPSDPDDPDENFERKAVWFPTAKAGETIEVAWGVQDGEIRFYESMCPIPPDESEEKENKP